MEENYPYDFEIDTCPRGGIEENGRRVIAPGESLNLWLNEVDGGN